MTERNVYQTKKGRNTWKIFSTLEIGFISNSSLTYSYSGKFVPRIQIILQKTKNVRQDTTNN